MSFPFAGLRSRSHWRAPTRTARRWRPLSARAVTPGTPISARRLVPDSPPSTRVTASAPARGSIGHSRNSARRKTPSFRRTLPELPGDTLVQAQRGSNLFKQSARNEHGQVIHGIGDTPPIQHEILTGSKWDGRAYTDNADHTCNNWTSSSTSSAQVGHSDRIGNGSSWNSSNATKGCSQAALESTGGAGLFYCFAIN